jgi:hypothetical protein
MMTTFLIDDAQLLHMAQRVSGLFSPDARYRQPEVPDGHPKSFFVEDPFGPNTANLSLRFPGTLLDRYDALSAGGKEAAEQYVVTTVESHRHDYTAASIDGELRSYGAYVITLGDEMLGDGDS